MRISRKAWREAKRLYRGCLVNGRLEAERVRAVVRRLVEGKPRGYLGMLSCLERLVRLELQRWRATVVSAQPLPAAFQGEVREKLTRQYGPGLEFEFGADASLIGGMRVQVGSDVYDGSVQARLKRLRESF